MNWFQNFVSLWSKTVVNLENGSTLLLWIGFKILYLCGLKQLFQFFTMQKVSCELVSKFCIFVVWNSEIIMGDYNRMLWIGFKILYLCGLKQCEIIDLNKVKVVNWFQNFVSLWSETVRYGYRTKNQKLTDCFRNKKSRPKIGILFFII